MAINYVFVAISSFLTGMILVFLLRRLSGRFKLLIPRGIPLVGGIAVGLSFIFACLMGILFFRELSQAARGIIAASFAMLVFGVIDDWQELSVAAKFIVQLIATAILVIFGVRTQIVQIGNSANIIITFIWVLGISNAFNHLDVIDGLAAGVALMVSLSFFIISFLNGDIENAILTLALSGSILGAFIYNLPPAKIYLGNSGSHFLGFILAAIAMAISYAPLERKAALLSPLLILGFPILDTAFLILIRLIKKSLPFKKSNDHLALRFLALGYSKRKVLFYMLGISLVFSLSGILVSRLPSLFGICIVIFLILASLVLTRKMSKVAIDG